MTASPTIASTTLASIDPATGETVGTVTVTAPNAINDVVDRARAAQPAWAALSFEERVALIAPAGRTLVERADELGQLLTREMGKPIKEATGEVRYCGSSMEEEANAIAAALAPDSVEDANVASTIYHDPLGVCAAITPWNFPMAMPHSLVLPALVAGNTVVLKPSEETPLIAQAYADALIASLPADVLQVVHGADDQGRALVASDVNLIAFTGSREVGQKILTAAGPDLKRVILELGGKDPLIVLHDVDVDAVAQFAARNSYRNAGQVCVSTERIYVDARIGDAFETALAKHTSDFVVGSGLDEETTVGPMINTRQRDHVRGQIDAAVRDGATLRAGGEPLEGNFLSPTLLTNLTHRMAIMTEETFGPVACVMRFADDDEAIRLANDTRFGLGAIVFGSDEHAAAVARQLGAGMIGINKGCGGADGTPWVGAGHSGYGHHSGRSGHRQFAQARVISVSRG